MNKKAIEVTDLKKGYRLRSEKSPASLRDGLTGGLKSLFKGFNRNSPSSPLFWALNGINFSIDQGSVLGVIGGNGAGKSTLLKILSRITEPTEGKVVLRGRVSSMLEVGTGFHPELSGRENIFLNGTLLGMKYQEIQKRFDEIVAFSGIEKFIDLPLKRYSTGMGLRLAFSVAAHLESDILVVDEILAVGDAEFQQRCIGKMRQIAGKGCRTVLFVSHNMSVIQMLCDRCLMLKNGSLVEDGSPPDVIQKYLQFGGTQNIFTRSPDPAGVPTFVHGKLESEYVDGQWRIWIRVDIETKQSASIAFHVVLRDATGIPVGCGSLGLLNENEVRISPGLNPVAVGVETSGLAMGGYWITLTIVRIESVDIQRLDHLENIFFFEHMPSPGSGQTKVLQQSWGVGSVHLPLIRG